MRVNVTYSVKLDEIKQIVEDLVVKLEGDLEEVNNLYPQIQDFIHDSNEKMAVDRIERCRATLSDLDHTLFDCQNILAGYQQTLLQMKNSNNKQEVVNEHTDVESG